MEYIFNGNKAQQGDVPLLRTSIPAGAKAVAKPDRALAYGESTGHAHVLVGGDVEFFELESKTYIRVLTTTALQHLKNFQNLTGEHDTIVLPPGEYQYSGLTEFDYDAEEALQNKRLAD